MSLDLQTPSPTLYSRKFSRLLLFWWITFFLYTLTFLFFLIREGSSSASLIIMESSVFSLISLIVSFLMLFEYKCCMEDLCEIQDPICQKYVEKISKNKFLYFLGIPLSLFCFSLLTMIPITVKFMSKKIKEPEPLVDILE